MNLFFDSDDFPYKEMISRIQLCHEAGLDEAETVELLCRKYDKTLIQKYLKIVKAALAENVNYLRIQNMFRAFLLLAFLINSLVGSLNIMQSGLLSPRTVVTIIAIVYSGAIVHLVYVRESGGIIYLAPIFFVVNPFVFYIVLAIVSIGSIYNLEAVLLILIIFPYLGALFLGTSLYQELPFEFERVLRVVKPAECPPVKAVSQYTPKRLFLYGISYFPIIGFVPSLIVGSIGLREKSKQLILIAIGGCLISIFALAVWWVLKEYS